MFRHQAYVEGYYRYISAVEVRNYPEKTTILLSSWRTDKFWSFDSSVSLPSVESISTVAVQNCSIRIILPSLEFEWLSQTSSFCLPTFACHFHLPNNGGTNVTMLDISLRNAGLFSVSFNLIVTKLRQTPNLTHLSLSLKSCVDRPFEYPPVELPNLTSLEVELWQFSVAELMTKMIVAKNIRSIKVVVHPDPWHSATT